MSPPKFLDYVKEKEIINLTSQLVSIDTTNPPGNEYKCTKLLTRKFKSIGLKVKTFTPKKGRTTVIGQIGSGHPSVALIAHTDIVPAGDGWKTDPFKPVVKSGKIYGRGSNDNKGDLAASWSAIKAFLKHKPQFKGSLYLVAVADEERASKYGIKALLKKGFKVDCALVPDAGYLDEPVIGEKGSLPIEIESIGKQAHGASPYRGQNAILPLADLLLNLAQIKFSKKHPRFKASTINIGTIEGGVAPNVVPAKATAKVDIRFTPAYSRKEIESMIKKEISKTKKKFPGSKFKHHFFTGSEPHILDQRETPLIKSFNRAAHDLGIKMKYKTIGGNTVAKILVKAGIPAFCHNGTRVSVAHQANEYVVIKDLVLSAKLYALTLDYFLR